MPGLTPKQKKIAKLAQPYDKITGADIKILRTTNARDRRKNK